MTTVSLSFGVRGFDIDLRLPLLQKSKVESTSAITLGPTGVFTWLFFGPRGISPTQRVGNPPLVKKKNPILDS